MKDEKLHITKARSEGDKFFSKGKILWEKSENEVWNELVIKMQKKGAVKSFMFRSQLVKYSVAALIFLLIGIGTVSFFYMKKVNCLPGEHLTAQLPDGSEVELNSDLYL